MSEEKPEYIIDALEMMGVSEPKQIITEVSGFIPVFEVVLKHFEDHMTALVFGRMWQYCGMQDGVCRASLTRIGNDLEISAATVMRHAEKLVDDGFLIDTTPDLKNKPHTYMDGRKVEMKSRFSASVSERNVGISQRNASVSESQLIKQDNTSNKRKEVSLTTEDLKQVNSKVDAMIGLSSGGASWQGRELIREDLLPLADWYNQATNQVMTKRVQKSWWKALGEWKEEGLTPEHLQVAFDTQSKWRLVSDPNMLTKDAVAVKAAGITKLVEPEIEYTRLL